MDPGLDELTGLLSFVFFMLTVGEIIADQLRV